MIKQRCNKSFIPTKLSHNINNIRTTHFTRTQYLWVPKIEPHFPVGVKSVAVIQPRKKVQNNCL